MGAAIKVGMSVNLSQHMAMTPQLLQSIRLLQLSTLELKQEVQQALDSNLMLEGSEDEEEAPSPAEAEAQAEAAASESTEVPVSGCDAQADSRVDADYDWSSRDSWSGGEPGDDEDEAIDSRRAAPVQTDARMSALDQLRLIIKDADDAPLAIALIENIDDNGYLEIPLTEILAGLPEDQMTTEANLERVLALVQSVEPSGFGARNLCECLLLQLRDTPADAVRDLAQFIISACLDRLAGGDLAQVRDALGVSQQLMVQAVDRVLALNPKPGASLAVEAQAIVPEIIVSGEPGAWKIELNPETLPRVRINGLYERALANNPHRALKDQLTEARWLIRGLEMRHETLIKTARAVFQRQAGFLAKGEEGMAPLTLREIAEAIGMHESTICRITRSKYALTPWGVYPLKDFFPSHIEGALGETSGTAVKAIIRRIIDAESRNAPLCDGDIAALLLRQGVRVARRTVAKYREAMHIGSAKERNSRMRSRSGYRARAQMTETAAAAR